MSLGGRPALPSSDELIATLATQRRYLSGPHFRHPWWLYFNVSVGQLDDAKIRAAWCSVVARHDGLRCIPVTAFSQRVGAAPTDVSIVDLSTESARWLEMETMAWPAGAWRWMLGTTVGPDRQLLVRVCHSLGDRLALRIVRADLVRALAAEARGHRVSWEPAPQLSDLVRHEQLPSEQARLRSAGSSVCSNLSQPWVLKAMPSRSGHRRTLAAGILLNSVTRGSLARAARSQGVGWHTLLRSSLLAAAEIVFGCGRFVVTWVDAGRRSANRSRCVAPLAQSVYILIDTAQSIMMAPRLWSALVGTFEAAALSQLPLPQLEVSNAFRNGAIQPLGEAAFRRPGFELDTSGESYVPPLHPGHDRPNVVVPAREWVRDARDPSTVILTVHGSSTQLVLFEDSSRCSPRSLNLLMTCWLAGLLEHCDARQEGIENLRDVALRARRDDGPGPVFGLGEEGALTSDT